MARLLVLFACIALLAAPLVTSFTFTIDRKECFQHHVENEGDYVYASFVVVKSEYPWGGADQQVVDLVVEAPAGYHVHTSTKKSEETFHFVAVRSGDYKFCFSNHSPIHETIAFDFHSSHIITKEEAAKDEHIDPLMTEISMLSAEVENAAYEVRYSFYLSGQHAEAEKKTGRRVIFKATLQSIALIGCGVAQVYLLRRLFERKLGQSRV